MITAKIGLDHNLLTLYLYENGSIISYHQLPYSYTIEIGLSEKYIIKWKTSSRVSDYFNFAYTNMIIEQVKS